MKNLTDLSNLFLLPNHYLQQLYGFLEDLAKKAIDDGDIETSVQLLSLILLINNNKQEATNLKKPKKTAPAEPDTRPRYKKVGYDQATKEMRDAIISLAIKKLINLNVDISSRSFYSIIERHHLSNIEASKLDKLMLPMSSARPDRPCWKEAVTQALSLLVEEGLMEKTGRYTYSWTDLARTEMTSTEVITSSPPPLVEEIPSTREKLPLEPVRELITSQPFASFSKPKIYGQEEANNGKREITQS